MATRALCRVDGTPDARAAVSGRAAVGSLAARVLRAAARRTPCYGHSGSTSGSIRDGAVPGDQYGPVSQLNSDTGRLARDQVTSFLNRYYRSLFRKRRRASRRRRARRLQCGLFVSTRDTPAHARRASAHWVKWCPSYPEGPGPVVLSGQEFQDPSILSRWNHGSTAKCATGNARLSRPANEKRNWPSWLPSGAAYERITCLQSPPFQLAIAD